MNTMPGTDQPAFGVVRPAQAMTQAPDFSSSKQPVKLGAVEFGLDSDLARVIGRFFRAPQRGKFSRLAQVAARIRLWQLPN